ncbi:MAG: hypothetical protein H6867_04810 [Rhodospirillales bacterium]|nr:hypothetical protein [Rhodospirillales bacterium]MCB9994822.1 hypothetical protein [Rhodospirillales bacterium]
MSKAEDVLNKLKELIEAQTSAKVERNMDAPEKIPTDGLIVIHDGDPGEPDITLGGFSNTYYSHAIEIEIYVQEGNATQRDAKFDLLLQQIDTVLQAKPPLEGVVDGLLYGRPEITTQAVEGGAAIKTGILVVQADYEAPTPIT